MTTLLEVSGLGMQFSGQAVLRDLSFAFGPGVVALMGENGAGKSTLLSLLSGVHPLQAGRVCVGGHDLATARQRARRQLAYAPDESVAYDFMTGEEFLRMVLALRGQLEAPSLPALVEGFGLQPQLHKRFEAMSLGTRKKFMLVSALASDAQVVLMDEPTNGIDAQAKAYLVALFRRECGQRLFFFSTHDQQAVVDASAEVLALPDPLGGMRDA
ncbi:ATP-binding cassette domain-containing protein [Massilia yuzhufengensis]|uniref:ABC transporter n=1 Tax=Massilia yuzhufengensis TaxID=1164594 RepID=A0A1I1J3H0_9BURK|nr:ABC transporter ATP-binding protein [Massilia yuzhufengensis]SFC43097.1 ABC transporter [Massilia yuzhufengensis]